MYAYTVLSAVAFIYCALYAVHCIVQKRRCAAVGATLYCAVSALTAYLVWSIG
ncbi:MAG: hypothetical protein Q4B99_03825 [Clostridia bacterium]|nr:hypothetical protein [Clostridia bacterium]